MVGRVFRFGIGGSLFRGSLKALIHCSSVCRIRGIHMDTKCAPLVADLFLFCYERDFMMSLFDDMQADIIDAFNTISRY